MLLKYLRTSLYDIKHEILDIAGKAMCLTRDVPQQP